MKTHFLLMTVGTSGDVNPFIGIGKALQQRGHEVSLVANEHFGESVRASGLTFVPNAAAETYRSSLQNPKVWHPRKGMGVLFKGHILPNLATNYRLIEERYVPGKTVVVATGIEFSARIAHEKLGVPLATINLQPIAMHSLHEPPNPGGWVGDLQGYLPRFLRGQLYRRSFRQIDRFLSDVNHFRATLGLPPATGILNSWKHSPQLSLGLWPDWYASPQRDWPGSSRLTGFVVHDGGASVGSQWQRVIDELGPLKPVVFTAGTGMFHGERFFEAAAAACTELQHPGLLLTPHAHQIPKDLPPYVRHLPFAPFDQLLPRAAAIIHHGGIGTAARALAAGIPQVIVPHAFDQFDNAERLLRLGVARVVKREDVNAIRMAWQLGSLLASPKVAARCAHWSEQLRAQAALDETCEQLETLIAL